MIFSHLFGGYFFSLALSIHLWYNEINERSDFMTNIENINMANRAELVRIFASQEWCKGCPLDLCGTKECVDHIET